MTSLAHPSYPSPANRSAYPARRRGQTRPKRRLAPLAVDAQRQTTEPTPTPTSAPVTLDVDAERLAALAAGSGMTALLYADAAATLLLSAEEERTLIARAQAGDEAARDHLVRANVRLVGSVCRWYLMRTPGAAERLGVGRDDLMQEGLIGLLKAIDKFDLALGHRFSTYAVQWIRQAMSRARDDRGLTIRLPVYLQVRFRRIKRLQDAITLAEGVKPTYDRLAETLGYTPEQVEEALDYGQMIRDPLSLDRDAERRDGQGDGDTLIYGDRLADPEAVAALEAVEEAIDKELAASTAGSATQIMADLKARGCVRWRGKNGVFYRRDFAREMTIVERRLIYGETLETISADLGITRERVRQLQGQGEAAIREVRQQIRQAQRDAEHAMAMIERDEETGGAA